MLKSINPKNLLYIDVETVPMVRNFDELNSRLQGIWKKKWKDHEDIINAGEDENDVHDVICKIWADKAALYGEFCKIIVIVMGIYDRVGNFRTKSYYGDNEDEILENFKTDLEDNALSNRPIVAHNGKGFDYPILTKRYVINKINPPSKLWTYGKKPWEVVGLLDTLEIWKFGAFGGNHGATLDTIAAIFDLPSPKEDMDGSEVGKYYYDVDGGLELISKYCTNDVISLCQVVLAMTNEKYPATPPKFV